MATFEELTESDKKNYLADVARSALARWGFDSDTNLQLINISENATFKLAPTGTSEPLIMRVHRTGYHSVDGVRSELAWMKALQSDAGVKTPQAIEGVNGEFIQIVHSPALNEERLVVLFHFIPGTEPDQRELSAPFYRLGAIAARMHMHSRNWRRPAYFDRLLWDYDHSLGAYPNWGRWQDGRAVDSEVLDILSRADDLIRVRLEAFGQSPKRFGLIHADLRLANLLESDGDTRVIDFDDCGMSWFLYDLASALSFMENRPDVGDLIDAWVKGYQTIAPLGREEVSEIPTFMMLRRLVIMAWVGSHPQTELARELGDEYTRGTVEFARRFLRNHDTRS